MKIVFSKNNIICARFFATILTNTIFCKMSSTFEAKMNRILPVIVISQFLCTSLWFAGNAVIDDITSNLHLQASYAGYLASAVQLGFIVGTLIFALLSIADRYSPSLIFFICAILAATANLAIVVPGITGFQIIICRSLIGFFLAGIYPVGMKIAADHYAEKLGRSLGFLVGALVLGTAFPHLLKSFTNGLPWQYVIFATSFLSLLGGCLLYLNVPDGPFRQHGTGLNFSGFLQGFKNPAFRAVALGYFGHQWEVYAFWVFVPAIIKNYNNHYPLAGLSIPILSFIIIASGCLACITGGLLAERYGLKKLATLSLITSGCCCIISPLALLCGSKIIFVLFLLVWGSSVAADSPLFSTLIAGNAPIGLKGSSLTIVNCIGYCVTITSIQLLTMLYTEQYARYIFMLLAIGPVLGVIVLLRDNAKRPVVQVG